MSKTLKQLICLVLSLLLALLACSVAAEEENGEGNGNSGTQALIEFHKKTPFIH